jgi:RNA polymerase sigma factor (TIGR02999 family)
MTVPEPGTVTRLLLGWRRGDQAALDQLTGLVYDELRRMARGLMRGERQEHTLQTTALVHEAYARLAGADVQVEDRVHFMSLAATAMRRILVDHARAHRATKRGGEVRRVTLEEAMTVSPEPLAYLEDLDAAMSRLGAQDLRKSQVVEMFFFGGMTQKEIACHLQISEPTVKRDLRMARAWLRQQLASPSLAKRNPV